MGSPMQLTVNGETVNAPEATALSALLADWGIDPTKVAIERNLEIVPRSLYGETVLADGDVLEVVEFVGGG
ncbi:MAG: sulfur carrier protein ThiS [Hyphomonadaceae bacterium]|nr:sulfur carrier protein ThiS [Hyphomonadaceae bacterium]